VRGDSTLAWLATAMLIATAPFIARAQFEDDVGTDPGFPGTDSGSLSEGPGSTDAAAYLDAGINSPTGDADPGPRLPSGEPVPVPFLATDAGGCSCRASGALDLAGRMGGFALALAGLAAFARRRR